MLTPLLAERLRQDVFDRQVDAREVDLLGVPVALFEAFEDHLPLLSAAAEVEGACPDRFAKELVGGPVAALP